MTSHRHHTPKHVRPIDRAMDVVSVVSPLMGVPQAFQIYQTQSATGLSLFSWLAFAGVAFVFLLYAVDHKIKPLIIAEALWLGVYAAVIPGIILYG